MRSILFLFAFVLCLSSCEKTSLKAQDIVDKSIEISGGENYETLNAEFDFRDKHYKVSRDQGEYQFEREFKDSTDVIRDVLTNNDFKRYINDEIAIVPDSMVTRYSSSVNSVHYFVQLPFGLNAPAVNKELIGEMSINGQHYHKVKVTFDQDGGGEDFEDVFVYWINTETFKADYIAYSYNEDHGIGLRFREAYNERYVKGIRFVDYNNYKPKNTSIDVSDLDTLFASGSLQLLSKIESKNIVVH